MFCQMEIKNEAATSQTKLKADTGSSSSRESESKAREGEIQLERKASFVFDQKMCFLVYGTFKCSIAWN